MTSLRARDEDAFDAYLDRIGFQGMVGRGLETLSTLHRLHLSSISYENLDIHLGVPLEIGIENAFQKIVMQRRGGWCFEMNTLFRWALERAGFKVTLIRGTAAFEGDHMLLLVAMNGASYLADMGWGNGFFEPLPLVEGEHRQGSRRFALARDGDRWRFSNLDFGEDGFSFDLTSRVEDDFAERSRFLQTDPESSFVRMVKAFRFLPDGTLLILRGAVLTTLSASGKTSRTIESADDYAEAWRSTFASPASGVADLWPAVHRSHLKWADAKSSG